MTVSDTSVTGDGANGTNGIRPEESSASGRPHRVLVVGGAYAGIAAVLALLDSADGKPTQPATATGQRTPWLRSGIEITLIDERDGFFHSVGTPLAHVAKGSVEPSWLRYQSISQLQRKEVQIHHGSIKHIDCEMCFATFANFNNNNEDAKVAYDYLILATGMRREWPIVPHARSFKDYVIDAQNHIGGVQYSKGSTVAVIGGGAVGIEFAAEMKKYHPHNRVLLIHSRDKLLSNEPLPDDFKSRTLTVLAEEGVEVILGQRASLDFDDDMFKIKLNDGRQFEAGYALSATSRFSPNTESLPRDAVDENGYVKVNAGLSLAAPVPNAECHFAVGDICHWSGIKRAGPAMVMGRVAATNVFNAILRKENSAYEMSDAVFPEVVPMMGLAVGTQAITYHPNNGVNWGPERMAELFGDDLGWANTLRFLNLFNQEPSLMTTA